MCVCEDGECSSAYKIHTRISVPHSLTLYYFLSRHCKIQVRPVAILYSQIPRARLQFQSSQSPDSGYVRVLFESRTHKLGRHAHRERSAGKSLDNAHSRQRTSLTRPLSTTPSCFSQHSHTSPVTPRYSLHCILQLMCFLIIV